jgi:hypothetical protein
MNDVAEIAVPAIFFIAVVMCIAIISYAQFRHKKLIAESVLKLIESDKTISPEAIHALASPVPQHKKDLRLGVILLSIAFAIVGFASVIELPTNGNTSLTNIAMGFAIFPAVMGGCFLLLSQLKIVR